jgi:hypothetical protein
MTKPTLLNPPTLPSSLYPLRARGLLDVKYFAVVAPLSPHSFRRSSNSNSLTCRQPALVGTVVAPCYPILRARDLLDVKYFAVVAPLSPHSFRRSSNSNSLTCRQPALVGTVVAPCYPISVPVASWTSSTSLSLRRCRLTLKQV